MRACHLLVATLLCVPAASQKATVFPSWLATREGNAAYADLLGRPRSRTQVLMAAAGFAAPRAGSIKALELRRDQGPRALRGRKISARMFLGAPAVAPQAMSTDFLKNWRASPVIVFQGDLNVPAQPPVASGPAAFRVVVPFHKPFAWQGVSLLLEVEVFSNDGSSAYPLDAVVQPYPRGEVQVFGTACRGPAGTPVLVPPDPAELIPGGKLALGLRGATPFAVALDIIGDSASRWGSVRLPFRWPGTSCFVYTSWITGTFRILDAAGVAAASYALPSSPALSGQTAYSQWGVFEGPRSVPPITTTAAVKVTVGQVLPVLFDSIVNADGSGTGIKVPGAYSALAVRLVLE